MLICSLDRMKVALPIEHVVETMRPLPVRSLPSAPPAVQGVAVIRGAPAPVVDLRVVLGADAATPTRLVTLRAKQFSVALAVERIIGVARLPRVMFAELPPLLSHAAGAAIAELGILDEGLLVVLRTSRILPEGSLPPLADLEDHA